MNRELWPHQAEALLALRQSIGQGVRRIVLSAPTGSGKTLLSAAVVEGALAKGNRVAFVVSSIGLVDQTVEALYAEGIRGIGVIQANHEMTDWSQPVQVASIQTIKSRKTFPQAHVVIIDECVRRGTKILTPDGERNIEDIRPGHCVFNALGVGVVQAVSRRRRPILRMRLTNGRELGITRWHPVFGHKGWGFAGSVERRARFFSQQAVRGLWKCVPPKAQPDGKEVARTDKMFDVMWQHAPRFMEEQTQRRGQQNMPLMWGGILSMEAGENSSRRKELDQARMLLDLLLEEIQEPDTRKRRYPEVVPHLEANWASAGQSRWEWSTASSPATTGSQFVGEGVDCRVGGLHEDASGFGVSVLLQDRHRQYQNENRDRDRWGEPRWPTEGSRSEEGPFLGDVGVEDISGDECGGDEDVFNLQVSGHPSYFAEGVLVHNCHVLHEEHKRWLQQPGWEKIPFIGLSATPYTRGLGKFFETMIVVSTTQELIDKGILSPFKVFATGHPDLTGVRTVAGDYHEGELSTAMQAGTLTADIVRTWADKWGHNKTLCFAVDCAHAQGLQQRFLEAGISCGYQDARTPPDERREIKRKFHSGEYRVVSNVGTLTVGIDWEVRCLILARPTRSEMLYQQIIGRALRKAPGKEYAMILDHSDTTQRLGFVTDIFHDHLDDGKPNKTVSAEEKKVPLPKECEACSAMRPRNRLPCPNCGNVPEIISGIIEQDGELTELIPGMSRKRIPEKDRLYTMEQKARFFAELKFYARARGYKEGWASNKFRDKHGVWPDHSIKHIAPVVYSMETAMWIKHTQIAWAKSQRRGEAAHA